MRSVLTKVLVFVGAFLIVLSLLATFYASSQVKRTPLDTNSVTRLAGTAGLYDGEELVQTPVKASSTTLADAEASTKDVVVFHNSSCLVRDPDGNAPDCVAAEDPDDRLVSAGTDVFATDRRTGMAVNDAEGLPADAEEKSGLINKFPFDVEQKTYPFWDSYVGKAIDTTFEGVEEIDGLETYKFQYTVEDGDIEIGGEPGKYDTTKTMWIDPVTGAIQDQEQHLVQKMPDGQTVVDLNFEFTDETVAANVESAKDSGSRLALIGKAVPLGAGVLGLLALAGGLLLHFLGSARTKDGDRDEVTRSDDTRELDVFDSDDEPTRRRSDIHRD